MISPPEHADTEALLRSALQQRQRGLIPPPFDLADLRRRAASDRPATRRGRVPALRLAAAATAVVLAAAGVTVGVVGGGAPRPPVVTAATLDLSGGAPMVLRRIADVTATTPISTPPRTDQFVYTKRVGVRVPDGAHWDYTGEPVPSQSEMWAAEDPTATGLAIFDGERVEYGPTAPGSVRDPYIPRTYAEFAALPTDPARMRAYLEEISRDPFDGADILSCAIVPPEVASAIYRALADVPGIVVDGAVVDAVGRPGIAISRTDQLGLRAQLIFSPDGSRLLGKRIAWTRDHDGRDSADPSGRAGQVIGDYAVVEQAVVDRAGDLPG